MGIVVSDVSMDFGKPPVHVLKNISLEVKDREFVSLTGRSGAGKSTLLYVMSSLDYPTSGKVEIDGHNIHSMESEELHRFRNRSMGFVFQFHYLIAELDVLQNVLMPARKSHEEISRLERAQMLLERCGLKEKMTRYPRQLSGGEQQRVSLARSLVMQPKYLFADEPTGALDSTNAEGVMQLLKDSCEKDGMTVVMVTHDPDFAAMAHREIKMADGQIIDKIERAKV